MNLGEAVAKRNAARLQWLNKWIELAHWYERWQMRATIEKGVLTYYREDGSKEGEFIL